MKHCVIRLVSILLAMLLLAGCGGSPRPEGPAKAGRNAPTEETKPSRPRSAQHTEPAEEAEPADKETESAITEAPVPMEQVQLEVLVGAYTQRSDQWWDDFEARFEADNPDVDLIIDVESWMDISTVLENRTSQNTAPDIVNGSISMCRDSLENGQLLPADAWLSDRTRDQFCSGLLQGFENRGTLWAVPVVVNPWIMVYNPEILAKAGTSCPTDWSELGSACQAIQAYDARILPMGMDFLDEQGLMLMMLNAGGGVLDENGEWALNSEENIEAVQYLCSMIEFGWCSDDQFEAEWTHNRDLFVSGEVAMMVMPATGLQIWESISGAVSYEVANFPVNIGCESATVAEKDSFFCMDNGQSEQERNAMERFFDFFYEDRNYADYLTTEGFYPATSGAARIMAREYPWLEEVVSSIQAMPELKNGWITAWWKLQEFMYEVLEEGENPGKLLDDAQYATLRGY